KRTTMIQSLYELWASGNAMNELRTNLLACSQRHKPAYCSPCRTFRICVETYNRKITNQAKSERINRLSYLDLKGSVNLNTPDSAFILYEYYKHAPTALKKQLKQQEQISISDSLF